MFFIKFEDPWNFLPEAKNRDDLVLKKAVCRHRPVKCLIIYIILRKLHTLDCLRHSRHHLEIQGCLQVFHKCVV